MPNLVTSPDRVNDFVIKFANVNGTGSASANSLIMKAIFRMGVPVTGKNYFPSNIQGLPTWYEIRVTREAYAARAGRIDIMVAMNAETYSKDVREVASGGFLIFDSTWPRSALLQRGDITRDRRAARPDGEREFRRRAQPHPAQEHRLCGRDRRAHRPGPRHHRRDDEGELRKEAQAPRFEHQGAAPGLRPREAAPRLPAAAARREAGQDPRAHHDRRQHGRRLGLRVRGSDRGGVVSDHPVHLAHGCLQELLRALPGRCRDRRAQLRGHTGGG